MKIIDRDELKRHYAWLGDTDEKWWWFSAYCEDYLSEYGKSDADSVDNGIEVTHWMPLPEPPKEDKL